MMDETVSVRLAVLIGLVCIAVAGVNHVAAQPSQIADERTEGKEALDRLVSRFQSIQRIRVVMQHGTTTEFEKPTLEEEYLLSIDGRVAIRQWRLDEQGDRVGRARWFSFVAPGVSIGSRPDQGMYYRQQVSEASSQELWIERTKRVPWIGVDLWAGPLSTAEDARFWRGPGREWHAESASVGVGLTWQDSDGSILLRWRVSQNGSTQVNEYLRSYEHNDWVFARQIKQTIDVPKPKGRHKEPVHIESVWQIIDIEVNPAGIEHRLEFDNNEFQASRIDSRTGDVFAPDGTLAYNENEVLRTIKRHEHQRKPWTLVVYGGVGLLAVVGGFVAWRRLRSA